MNDNFNYNIVHIEEAIAETYPVATIKQKPSEIEQIIKIEFTKAYDDLDYLVFAILNLPSKNRVGLISHQHSPDLGTEICISYEMLIGKKPHSISNVVQILEDTLVQLNFSPDDLTWVHPDYDQRLKQSKTLELLHHIHQLKNSPQGLVGINLSKQPLKHFSFVKNNLNKAIFAEADLSKSNLQEVNLIESNLYKADLRGANLSRANLGGANLQQADLRGANLNRADLRETDLRGADFQRANLKGTVLNKANLDGASFKDADLESADLYEVNWNIKTMWFHVIGLHKANGIPENLRKQPNFNYCLALSRAVEKLKNGNIEEFRKIYKDVLNKIDDVEIAASLWNKIAWLSILYGRPDEESHKAALKAIKLKENQGNYHDTLGVVLALRGEIDSARKEFEIALEREDTQRWSEESKQRRKIWIDSLKDKKNPFEKKELTDLLNFEY